MEYLIEVLLAVYGVSHLLVWEEGPYDILSKLRYWFGVRYGEGGVRYGEGSWGNLLNCQICTSVWISLPIALLCMFQPIAAALAAIGFVSILMEVEK